MMTVLKEQDMDVRSIHYSHKTVVPINLYVSPHISLRGGFSVNRLLTDLETY